MSYQNAILQESNPDDQKWRKCSKENDIFIRMKYSAKTIFVFGIYMLIEGAALLVVPNLVSEFLSLPSIQDIWTRLVGIALLVLGYYYIRASLSGLTKFFEWTVQVRIFQFFLVSAIVFFESASIIFIILSGIELVFGLWTFYVLKTESKK